MGLGNWLFGSSDQEKLDRSLDAQLRTLNEKDYGKGGRIYNAIETRDGAFAADSAYQTVENHLATQEAATASEGTQLDQAFYDGLSDGYNNVTGGINSGLKAPFQFLWKALPWQVWVVAIGFGFFYLGGFKWLKGILAK